MPTAASKLGSGNDVRGSNGSWGIVAVDEKSREEKSKGGMASMVGKGGVGPGWLPCKFLVLGNSNINSRLGQEMKLEGWLPPVARLYEAPRLALGSSQSQAPRTS